MVDERKIKLNNRTYYLGIELKYKKGKILSKADGSYFDMGDLSIMIDYFEKKYKKDAKDFIYDKDIAFMDDVLYLYDRFPFVSYIKSVIFNDDGIITFTGCISKKEIIKYIKENKIKMNRWDKSESRCPLLYK